MPNYEEVIERAGSLRAMTGLTQQEFTALLPHFEHAFLAYMADRTIDGQPRMSRRYSTYETSPLPTMADKLLFILTYVKQNPIQEVQGQLFGISQSNANKWIHLLHAVLNQALAHQELLPARTADDLATRLAAKRTEAGPTSALFFMMVPNDPSTAQKIPRTSKNITVARRSVTRSKTSS
jgi:Helix-turn-helix of DDE superfamily endonuclease